MVYVMSSLIGIQFWTVNTSIFPEYTHNFRENIEWIFVVCKGLILPVVIIKIAKFSSIFLSFIYLWIIITEHVCRLNFWKDNKIDSALSGRTAVAPYHILLQLCIA